MKIYKILEIFIYRNTINYVEVLVLVLVPEIVLDDV